MTAYGYPCGTLAFGRLILCDECEEKERQEKLYKLEKEKLELEIKKLKKELTYQNPELLEQ